MSHECSCGASFRTLSKLRLHQRDECPDRDVERDISDLDLDAIADETVEELLICDVCGASNDGANGLASEYTDAGLSVTLTFECEACTAWNDNTAILSGEST